MKDRNYKKVNLILTIVTMAAVVISAASFSLKREIAVATQGTPTQNYASYYTSTPASSQEIAPSPSAAPQESYLVTVYDGKIGVFKEKENSPFLTADVDVYLLPQEDLKILRKGIRAGSFTEVKSILEDYE